MFEFTWTVFGDEARAGYKWLDYKTLSTDPPKEGPFLSTGLPFYVKRPHRRYEPLQYEPALFRIFAQTPATKKGIREFANEYGLLYRDTRFTISPLPLSDWDRNHTLMLPKHTEPDSWEMAYGEALDEWQREILKMRQIVELWELAKSGRRRDLAKYISWHRSNNHETDGPLSLVCYDSHPGFKGTDHPALKKTGMSREDLEQFLSPPMQINDLLHPSTDENEPFLQTRQQIVSPHRYRELLQYLDEGDVIQPALCYVQIAITQRLQGHVSPILLWDTESVERKLYLQPETLKDALWLQFAQAVASNKTYRACPECPKWFELSPEHARTNRRYCSDACRIRGYRRRKNQAQELYDNGMSVPDIAQQLGSKDEDVQKWIIAYERNRFDSEHVKKPRGRPRKVEGPDQS